MPRVGLTCTRCGEHSLPVRVSETVRGSISCKCPVPAVAIAFFDSSKRVLATVPVEEKRG